MLSDVATSISFFHIAFEEETKTHNPIFGIFAED